MLADVMQADHLLFPQRFAPSHPKAFKKARGQRTASFYCLTLKFSLLCLGMLAGFFSDLVGERMQGAFSEGATVDGSVWFRL